MIGNTRSVKRKLFDFAEDNASRLMNFGGSLVGLSARRRDRLRAYLYFQQGMRCCFCEQKMRLTKIKNYEKQPDDLATFEHLIDEWKSQGGKNNSLDNIALSCYRCNNGRNQWRQSLAHEYYIGLFGSKHAFYELTKNMSQREISAKFGAPKIPDLKVKIKPTVFSSSSFCEG